ncbi:MAG TPA: hypothetical protein VM733_05785 [Thermoanaerobaculia bacterium]|nr:hypothetical protein [Thermoanaerobaculia bacterium]
MLQARSERRRYGRIKLDEPLAARFGDDDARVIELSVVGFLIEHEGRFEPGEVRHFAVDWKGAPIPLECSVARSILYRLGKTLGTKSIYHTGLRVIRFESDGFERLRQLIATRIVRALDEMKANARGIPPLAAYMYQPYKGELFRRCELVDGTWRKSETIRPNQPPNGFTVSAEVEAEHIDILCEDWERTTQEGRRLTQLLAELSISTAEGIPTRRYVP